MGFRKYVKFDGTETRIIKYNLPSSHFRVFRIHKDILKVGGKKNVVPANALQR